GSLYQDLPLQHPSDIIHHQPAPYDVPSHQVKLVEGTPLYKCLFEGIWEQPVGLQNGQQANLQDGQQANLQDGQQANLQDGPLAVNSCHHQAIKDLAPGLEKMAISEDGLVEAFYLPDYPFLWAVQWHPEFCAYTDKNSQKIFRAFVNSMK
ncbi:MAG: gamma-glutamyl-gamma-aminobutyrate hydrolase family protein, partial [Oscillospiraceae bacterium]|nr:gamma-glutamyl-gamma-aminobutyrate hydrolase family protein [Oscillospiraceae bacterium]